MSKGNILFLDDDVNYLSTRAKFLKRANYTVFEVKNLGEAFRRLDTSWIHLMLLDVRLDEIDSQDKQGLELAEHKKYTSIPKVIQTGHPNFQDTRRALRPVDGEQIALDYLYKGDEPAAMVALIDKIFEEYVQHNNALALDWADVSQVQLVEQLSAKSTSQTINERIDELEGLFRAIFRGHTHLAITKSTFSDQNGIVLLAQATKESNLPTPYVIRCGNPDTIGLASQRHAQISAISASLLKSETPRFAGFAYALDDFGQNLQIYNLNDLFNLFSADYLNRLLGECLREQLTPIHGLVQQCDVAKLQQFFHAEQFPTAETLNAIGHKAQPFGIGVISADSQHITIDQPNTRSLTLQAFTSENAPALDEGTLNCGMLHGNLRAETLLFNQAHDLWLTDLAPVAANQPLIIDYILLERNLRLQWANQLSLSEWQLFEAMVSTDELLADESPIAGRLYRQQSIVQAIRDAAQRETKCDDTTYEVGLFWALIQHIASFDSEAVYSIEDLKRFVHVVVSVAMLNTQIGASSETANQLLKFDSQTQSIQLGRRKIDLTPTEYELFAYLYDHANELRSRLDIARDVFETGVDENVEDDEVVEYHRVNTAINRLRHKIEVDPKRPVLLKTIRGKGYRLEIEKTDS